MSRQRTASEEMIESGMSPSRKTVKTYSAMPELPGVGDTNMMIHITSCFAITIPQHAADIAASGYKLSGS